MMLTGFPIFPVFKCNKKKCKTIFFNYKTFVIMNKYKGCWHHPRSTILCNSLSKAIIHMDYPSVISGLGATTACRHSH